jgi:hypothetical protein
VMRGLGVRGRRVVVRPWLLLCALERGGVRDVDYWDRINGVLVTRCEIGNREGGSSRECWLVGWWFLSQSKVPNKKLVLEVARACSIEGVPSSM